MNEPMPPLAPPGRKHDIAPASRSAQSLGLNARPSSVLPWMKNWRGSGCGIEVGGTGDHVLCLALLRRTNQVGYREGSCPCNPRAFRMFLPLADPVGSVFATRPSAFFFLATRPERIAMTQPAAMPHVMNTYGRLPFALSHARGCRVWDTDGREYLNALGGIAVNTLGHAHPQLVAAIADQAGKLIHTSNYYQVPLQETLGAMLCERSGMSAAFFCSTGLEANEGAIKIARKYGHDKGIERPEIIVCERAFHGRSLATLSATGNPKIQAGFRPLGEGFG